MNETVNVRMRKGAYKRFKLRAVKEEKMLMDVFDEASFAVKQ